VGYASGKDGVTALHEMKITSAQQKTKSPFICLMIDSADPKSMSDYELNETNKVIKKPVMADDLVEAINETL